MHRHDLIPLVKVQRLLGYSRQLGVPSTLLNELELSLASRSTPTAITIEHYGQLYRRLVSAYESLGIHVPWAAGVGSRFFTMLCHSLYSCTTVLSTLQRACCFYDLSPQMGYRMRYQIHNDELIVQYRVDPTCFSSTLLPTRPLQDLEMEPQDYFTMASMSGAQIWHRLLGWLSNSNPTLRRIEVPGRWISTHYQRRLYEWFGNQTTFSYDHEYATLVYPAAVADERLKRSDHQLTEFPQRMPVPIALHRRQFDTIATAIKTLLSQRTQEQLPHFEEIARTLGISPSSLRRRLSQENTCYQTIKDEWRREQSLNYLKNERYTIRRVAEMLGIEHPSSFTRNFRKWYALSPQEYRARLRAQP